MPALIEVRKLCKTFYNHQRQTSLEATSDISFSVPHGDFLGIVGPSGSGKSTIIRCIYGTYLTTSGDIFYDSQAFGLLNIATASPRTILALRRQEIGYVSQFLSAMPRTTAFNLVVQSLLDIGVDESQAKIQAGEALIHFGIGEKLWDAFPNTFSGGEKLRLNIAKAVVKEPRLLLLDEPTASLDHANKLKVRAAIERLKAQGTTMIGIFHDLEFMEGLCDQVFDMKTKRSQAPLTEGSVRL